jgi:peptidoglycan/xylan/chitin deacetylase (PgdA/CDA1 family)
VGDALVLCYHAVSPTWPTALSLTPERLSEQVHHLAGRGWRGTTFTDLVTGRPAPRSVAVTFDDGYRSVLELARPILDEVGWPGTLYVPTDFIGREAPMAWPGIDEWLGGPHERELLPLGWDDLRALRAAGWEIGSHTRSHPHLTRTGDGELAGELAESRATCERELGDRCRSIAYPYGDVDERVARAAREAGYEAGAGLPPGRHVRSTMQWPRVGVYHDDDLRRFRLKASRAMRALQASPAWELIAAARSRPGQAEG